MTQETRVFELSETDARSLEARLLQELQAPEWRQVPHARFSVKAEGVILTCYRSGKVVVQGRALDPFCDRFLAAARAKKPKSRSSDEEPLGLQVTTIGSDEAGKGDYFGPLVVTALFARPEDDDALRSIGVVDSKVLSDARAMRLAAQLEENFDHCTLRVDPPEYNQRHSETGNLNLLLAALHGEAIADLLTRHPDTDLVLVDRFGATREVLAQIRAHGGRARKVVQVPRAERNPAVAAASIIARAAFLDGLAEMEDVCGTDLHKGAGSPVDLAARRVHDIGGRELLGKVAKLHFKNTAKIGRSTR